MLFYFHYVSPLFASDIDQEVCEMFAIELIVQKPKWHSIFIGCVFHNKYPDPA